MLSFGLNSGSVVFMRVRSASIFAGTEKYVKPSERYVTSNRYLLSSGCSVNLFLGRGCFLVSLSKKSLMASCLKDSR